MIAQPGDLVKMRAVVTQNQVYFSAFEMHIAYPEGMTPQTDAAATVPYPEGIYDPKGIYDPYGALAIATDDPARRYLEIVSVGGGIHKTTGPILEIPFQIGDLQAPASLPLAVADASYVTGGEACGVMATPTASSIRIVPPGGSGDIDGDGQVTLGDATLALRFVAGSLMPSQAVMKAADVSPVGGDGSVTLEDVRAILQTALGFSSTAG
jgi:hypothetical protein